MIEDYLHELRAQLRIPADDIVAEVEDHLLESAAIVGDAEAIRRFGTPATVATRFHDDVAERDARRSTRAVVIAGLIAFVGFLAGNTAHPPAPWPDRALPLALDTLLHLAMLAGQVAVACGAIALFHRARRHQLAAIRAACAAALAAVVGIAFDAAFELDRLRLISHGGGRAAAVIAALIGSATAIAVLAVTTTRAARRVGAFADVRGAGLLPYGWAWCAAIALLAGVSVFAHDEATRVRSVVDGGVEAAAVVAAFALLRTRLALAADAAYTARRTRR